MKASLKPAYAGAVGVVAAPGDFASDKAASAPRLLLRPYADCRELWEELAGAAPQAGLYHSTQWHLILNLAYGMNFVVAAVEDGARPVAGCVLARSRKPFSRRLIALPFSDYCPPLELRPGGAAQLAEALAPRLSARRESCELRGVAAPAPWRVDDRFQHWSVDLRGSAATIEKAMDRNFRRQVRRAREAGLTVSQGSSTQYAERFYALHLENRRRLGLPAPPWRFFRLVAEVMGGCGRFEVWLASAGGRDLGGVVLLKDRAIAHCKWSARAGNAPSGAMQLLFWSVCTNYAGAFDTLDLGRTDIRNEGLSRFKREIGAAPAPLPYAFYPDPPAQISSEDLSGTARIASALWRRLPPAVARAVGGAVYGYLS
jgi:Acetyltransferase (GNAT) domain